MFVGLAINGLRQVVVAVAREPRSIGKVKVFRGLSGPISIGKIAFFVRKTQRDLNS